MKGKLGVVNRLGAAVVATAGNRAANDKYAPVENVRFPAMKRLRIDSDGNSLGLSGPRPPPVSGGKSAINWAARGIGPIRPAGRSSRTARTES